MELVTEPDIKSAKEAKSFSQELQLILRYLGVSEADMEKGQLRVEANISLSDDPEKLGTKVEVKNLNSFRSVERAIDFVIARQKEILEKKGKISQETRGWSEPKQETVSQRLKEEANDYRYFPEPDLPPLNTSSKYVQELCEEIGELPQQRRKRFLEEYGLTENEVESFVVNKDLGEYYEKSVSELRNWVKEADERKEVNKEEFLKLAKIASNYILSDLLGLIKAASVVGEDFLITPENFGEFITLVYKGIISSKTAKEILKEMFATGKDPSHILKKRELSQITDKGEIDKAAKEVSASKVKVVEDFKKGK
jgi:aspartyl-tRNA(Asn)/glutamyl-tRNA(Gln) amidotransferase subunit B